MEPRQQRFSIGYFVAAVIALFLIQSFLFGPHPENLAYSDFKVLLKHGKVSDLTLGSQTIIGTLAPAGLDGLLPKDKIDELKRFGKGTHRFITARVDDPTLVPDLEASKIRFAGHVENTWLSTLLGWVLPTALFFGLWVLISRRLGGAKGGLFAIGKSKARVSPSTE